MPQIEWFYAKNDQPCGPVSPVELKRFAEQGELHEEDLVWREGMGEWIPAGKVKGLFDSNGEGAAHESPGGEQTLIPPSNSEVPARAIPSPPPAAAELPIRATPTSVPTTGEAEPEPPRRGRQSEEVKVEAEPRPFRHPLDALADLAREQFDAHFVHSTIVLFRMGGQIGIFMTIAVVLFLALAVGSKTGTTAACMQLAVAGVLALLLGHYTAGRLFPAMENLDRASRAVLSTNGPFDCLAWTMTVVGLFALIGLAAYAIATATAWPAFLAVGAFIVCLFTAVVAWNPRAMWLEIGPATTPGREAAAALCFLAKLLWRLSVVAYGAGIVLGTIAALNVAVHIGLLDAPTPNWFTAELAGPVYLLLFAIPLPVVGYVVFLVLQLLAELAQAALGNKDRRR